jgi:hypothetical protein
MSDEKWPNVPMRNDASPLEQSESVKTSPETPNTSSSVSSKIDDDIKSLGQMLIQRVNTRTRQILERLDNETEALDRTEELTTQQLIDSINRFQNMHQAIHFWERVPMGVMCAKEQTDCLKCFREKSNLIDCTKFIEAFEKCSSRFVHQERESTDGEAVSQ